MDSFKFIKYIDPDFVDYFPAIIYKYRDWINEFHKKIILDRELYFSNPGDFNDPFDCNLTLNFESCTENEILEIYRSDLKILNPEWRFEQIQEEALGWLKSGQHRDPKYLKKISTIYLNKLIHLRTGVACFSVFNDNLQMWAHYANNHKGICIGFVTKLLAEIINNIIIRVNYTPRYPIIQPSSNNLYSLDINNLVSILSTKHISWQYEGEVRFILPDHSNRVLKLPSEVYKQIILGVGFIKNLGGDTAKFKKFIEYLRREFPNAEIFFADRHFSRFELQFYKIK